MKTKKEAFNMQNNKLLTLKLEDRNRVRDNLDLIMEHVITAEYLRVLRGIPSQVYVGMNQGMFLIGSVPMLPLQLIS